MDKITKFLAKLDLKLRLKILEIMQQLLKNDLENLDIKPIKGFQNFYRVRVGKVRIMFTKNREGHLKIMGLDFRKDIYRKLK